MFCQTSCQTKMLILIGVSVGILNACSSNPATTTQSVPASPTTVPTPTAASPSPQPAAATPPAKPSDDSHATGAQHGGQVVEMGNYHLELLAAPEGEKIHVDFWLLTGANHASVQDAKVIANIQFPNGTQKSVDLVYDQAGQHYKALVPGFATGEYRVVVQTNHKGEKVNGRFNFKL